MRTRTRLITIAASLAVAGSAVIGIGPAALAQRAEINCSKGWFCLYQYHGYRGRMQAYHGMTTKKSLGTFNNTASSMINHSGHTYRLYSRVNFKGSHYTAKNGDVDKSLSNNDFDNTAASLSGSFGA